MFVKKYFLLYLISSLVLLSSPNLTAENLRCSSLYATQDIIHARFGTIKHLLQADIKDLENLIKLSQEIYANGELEKKPTILPTNIDNIQKFISEDKNTHYSKIYLNNDGEVIAFLLAKYDNRPKRIHIEKIAVSASERGKGIATELLYNLALRAKERSKEFIELLVLKSNDTAIKYYNHLGFQDYSNIEPTHTTNPTYKLVISVDELLKSTEMILNQNQ